jgi:DNA mismatch repair protein MutS2
MTMSPNARSLRPLGVAKSIPTATRVTFGFSKSYRRQGRQSMDEHALSLLEFSRVREALSYLCASSAAVTRLGFQEFLTERGALEELLGRALEFRTILESGKRVPDFDFPDIEQIIPRLGKDGLQFDGEELAALGRWILSGLKFRHLVLVSSSASSLARYAEEVPDLSHLSRKIFRILDHDGQLREKQIPQLAVIRERIRRIREDAERSVRTLLEDHASRGYWQTSTPTQRDGRVVLPLKSQYRGRVKGIVHETSSSGSTLFIEPLEIVEKNNSIVQEENLYRLEVRKILRELTSEVSRYAAEVNRFVRAVSEMDTWLARARYAISHRCCRAGYETDQISLIDARHPLLTNDVVPVTLIVGKDQRVLIITGPNTGGKTVSLKMVGILSLMNQFGMEIPAAEGSSLPLFDSIYADIGDEQSIEQSLSTFSAHVKNLATIVKSAGAKSLVLVDELGAGTDPQEGVALAMALLDHFMACGCIALATTHHGILKNYGATRPGAQNASMGFDRETFAPTFRILMGVPGESHALEIARRSGMPESVLNNALSYLEDERTDISRLVANLAERHQRLTTVESEQKEREHTLREERKKTDLKELALRQKELELRRNGLRELRDFISKARKDWEELREKTGTSMESDFGRLAAGIQARIESEEQRIEEERDALAPLPSFELHPGMEVVIARTGRRGRAVRPDKNTRWIVETETLRLSLPKSELLLAPPSGPKEGPPLSVSYSAVGPVDPPVLDLHIRGMRLEEAMKLVEKQVDSAVYHGLHEFTIVHGKGEGILRTAVHRYLRSLQTVEEFHFSLPEEGGFGRTIVRLK